MKKHLLLFFLLPMLALSQATTEPLSIKRSALCDARLFSDLVPGILAGGGTMSLEITAKVNGKIMSHTQKGDELNETTRLILCKADKGKDIFIDASIVNGRKRTLRIFQVTPVD